MNRWNFEVKNYNKKGIKNKRMNNKFIKICKMEQMQLKRYLESELRKYYKNVIAQNGFLYVKGKDKICLTAHMDTVHAKPVKDYYVLKEGKKTIISSPQGIGGDDRCGIFMILKILERTNLRPTIIFCEDEEIGGVGSNKFCNTKFIEDLKKMYMLIELDRKGDKDLVFYSDVNDEYHKYLEEITDYKENYGSFSDISHLSPACGISSVNISCGYYNAHTTSEYVVLEEMENSIKTTIKIMKDAIEKNVQYEYKKREYNYYSRFTSRFNTDDDFEYYYPASWNRGSNSIFGTESKMYKSDEIALYVQWKKDGIEYDDMIYGVDENECWVQFFMEHGDVCYNDVLDYETYDDDEYDFYKATYSRKIL